MDLKQEYYRINREAMWRVLITYGVGEGFLNGIKSIYVDNKACVRINEVESKWFKNDRGARQGCVKTPWHFNLYMYGEMKELLNIEVGKGVRLIENGKEWKVPCLLYADDLVSCSESVENLRLGELFGRVCKRRGMKVNVDKSKMMVVSEGNTQCQIMFIGKHLQQVSEF